MAKQQSLKLSDLRCGVDYPVGTQVQERRCLFHVKLTDFSMRSIEDLINSDKGAFFSLWFSEGGGTISIPGSKEDRKFLFKTAQGDLDGQGSLECVHQAVDMVKQPRLTCWGQIRHKLQVQATKEVYERTKKLMKETEEQKQKNKAQAIQLPHTKVRLKPGGHTGRPLGGRPPGKSSSPFSTTVSSAAAPTISVASVSGNASGNASGGSFSQKVSGPSPSIGKSSVSRKLPKAPHTLRERIIHLLAVKPQKRADIVLRLKKETKRGENAMSRINTLLQEVADTQGDVFYLKQALFSEIHVNDWPFYSEAERQLVKRKHNAEQNNESVKRSLAAKEFPPPKKQKLSQSSSATTLFPPQPSSLDSKQTSPPLTTANPPPSSAPQLSMPLFGVDNSNSVNSSNIETEPSVQTSVSASKVQSGNAQFPGSVASSFILGSSNSTPAQPVSGPQQTRTAPSQTSSYMGPTSQGRNGAGMDHGGSQTTAEDGLIAGLVSHKSQLMEVDSGPKKKDKKKKKKKKQAVPENHSASALAEESQAQQTRDLKMKSEEEETMKDGGVKAGEKRVKSEAALEENGASSTTPSVEDIITKYPPVSSAATRAEYKQIFNDEYQEYLDLKAQVEAVTNEVTALTERMAKVKKGTEEAKILKRKVRAKYTELQQNVEYQERKRRFQELYAKLGHIKKLIVEYDQSH